MASCGRDGGVVTCAPFALGEEPGAIVAGFDVHRRQITVDALDTATGEVSRGQVESTPAAVEEWVARFPGRVVHVAVEACTGWLFVCRALERLGAIAYLAEPVEASALRGRKRRAKTDRADAKWLRELLVRAAASLRPEGDTVRDNARCAATRVEARSGMGGSQPGIQSAHAT
jgi:transposase